MSRGTLPRGISVQRGDPLPRGQNDTIFWTIILPKLRLQAVTTYFCLTLFTLHVSQPFCFTAIEFFTISLQYKNANIADFVLIVPFKIIKTNKVGNLERKSLCVCLWKCWSTKHLPSPMDSLFEESWSGGPFVRAVAIPDRVTTTACSLINDWPILFPHTLKFLVNYPHLWAFLFLLW